MAKAVSYLPKGNHTLTPYLTIRGAAEAMEFYKKAFGAKEVMRMPGPTGKVMHAEMQFGDSLLYISEEFPEYGNMSPMALKGSPVTVHMYVPDVDATVQQASAAGAKVTVPPTDMFWGDRFAKIADPFGHNWSLATHKEDLSPEEVAKRSAAAFK